MWHNFCQKYLTFKYLILKNKIQEKMKYNKRKKWNDLILLASEFEIVSLNPPTF